MEVADEKIVRIASLTRLYLPMSGAMTVACGQSSSAWNIGMADDQRLAGELRPVALLDGGIEGIAIDMGDAEALDLRMRQKPRAAASAARFGGAGDDFTAIPAQRTRHGSRSIRIVFSNVPCSIGARNLPRGSPFPPRAARANTPVLSMHCGEMRGCYARLNHTFTTHSMRYACELPPPCAANDAYYVSRARHAGHWSPHSKWGWRLII